jgi:hypothetical protein
LQKPAHIAGFRNHPSDLPANRDGGHPIRDESAQTPFLVALAA